MQLPAPKSVSYTHLTAAGILLTTQLYRKPTLWAKRSMKIYMVFLNGWISVVYYMLFRRGALRSLSVAHTLPSSQSYAGYLHTFPCTAPRYAGSLPSHCLLYTSRCVYETEAFQSHFTKRIHQKTSSLIIGRAHFLDVGFSVFQCFHCRILAGGRCTHNGKLMDLRHLLDDSSRSAAIAQSPTCLLYTSGSAENKLHIQRGHFSISPPVFLPAGCPAH